MREDQFRNKIQWFTFIFSILVIWVHSYNAELFLGNGYEAKVIDRAERLVGELFSQISVPGFFMISGYLFFRNFRMDRLWSKWNSRIRSVLVPFIVWNTMYYFIYVIGSRLPWLRDVVDKGAIPFGLLNLADAVLNYRYNYVFWYLYQLILLILAAPVIYLAVSGKITRYLFLAGVTFALFAGIRLPLLNTDALLFYGTAAYWAVNHKKEAEGSWTKKRCFFGGIILLGAAIVYWCSVRFYSTAGIAVYRFLVPLGLWLMIDEKKIRPPKPWMKINFFLYASHFLLVRFINKAAALYLSGLPYVPVILFVFMPFLVLAVCYPVSLVIQKGFPAFWYLINGGRDSH